MRKIVKRIRKYLQIYNNRYLRVNSTICARTKAPCNINSAASYLITPLCSLVAAMISKLTFPPLPLLVFSLITLINFELRNCNLASFQMLTPL